MYAGSPYVPPPHPPPEFANDTTVIFETQFNDILVYKSNPHKQFCSNYKDRKIPPDVYNVPDAPNYPHVLKFAAITFYFCRAAMIRNCGKAACIATMDRLKSVIPPCHTWPGLEKWALQVAACWCCFKSESLGRNIQHICKIVMAAQVYHESAPDVYAGEPGTFTDWARQVNHREVIPLLSWLNGSCLGRYEDLSMYMPELAGTPRVLVDGYRDIAIDQAISRVRELHLCPHRVWAIAFSMPGRESNIPALVPDKHLPCSYQHDYCSTGLSHKNCTYDYCEISAVNFTGVVQCHRPNCDGKCQKKLLPVHLLDQAANENRPTAWAVDGELRPLESGERYITISHVWSDGTGGSGSVNECMFNFFCDVTRKLNCKGLWWDAICIPQDKYARAKAISRMHEYYSHAAFTVVHDACLAMSEWVDSEHASFALIMSNWFTRGWTALELSRSKRVLVLFSTRERTGYVLKSLDLEVLSGYGTVTSLSRQAATAAIYALRHNSVGLVPADPYTLNDVLTALGSRFTSWARDRAIIAGQFIGIENIPDDQYSIYQQIVCKIGDMEVDHLFHRAASPAGPFAWLPSNLFDLPLSRGQLHNVKVFKDGSLLSKWGIILLPVKFHFSWDTMHPMSRYRVRAALNDDKHIILFSVYEKDSITRGLVVKVMTDISPSDDDISSRYDIFGGYDIRCRYIGPVYFAPEPMGSLSIPLYSVLISDCGADLDTGVSAGDHIKTKERKKERKT